MNKGETIQYKILKTKEPPHSLPMQADTNTHRQGTMAYEVGARSSCPTPGGRGRIVVHTVVPEPW